MQTVTPPQDTYLQYHIGANTQEMKDWLVAVLTDLGVEGFEEQPELLVASGLESAINEDAIDEFLEENSIDFEKRRVQNENWNAIWEKSFEPVVVDVFAGIRAHFHQPITGVKHEVIITPKMSFGTGHHATTWMMVKAMEALDFDGKTVIDFGTGTGVLAILAEKLGASAVTGIDHDPWSIDNANENLILNQCLKTGLLQAEDLGGAGTADIILANINRNVLLDNRDALQNALQPGGILVISGLLLADEPVIQEHFLTHGFSLAGKYERQGWLALVYKKPAE